MGALLTRAWDENRVLVHVDDVPKGASCGCICPICEKPLYARQGEKRTHHFSHAYNHNCKGSDETLLHQMAKEVLLDVGKIMLPPSSGEFPSGLVKLHNIESEKWEEQYHIKPDVVGIMDNGSLLLIEFYVSHKVDRKKRKIILSNNLNCLEIDLGFQDYDKASLREFLTNSTEDREWIAFEESAQKTDTDSVSYSSKRNPVYGLASDMLKQIFKERTLYLHPYLEYQNNYSMFNSNVLFDLKELGYDFHKAHYNNRRYKCDILLSKMKENGKRCFIAISVRGRCRPEGFRHPQGWMIIDIILKRGSTIDNIKERWTDAVIVKTPDTNIIYTGFDEWFLKEKPLPKKMVNKKDVSLPNQL